MALMSARMPAPPEGSTPAMVSAFGITACVVIACMSRLQGLKQAFFRRTRIGAVELSWNAAGTPGFAPSFHGFLHGTGHEHGITRACDGRIHQNTIAAQFHGDGGVGCGAH